MSKLLYMKKNNFLKIFENKHIVLSITLLFILGLMYVVLYKIYIPRINAFGCFDDCFNFMGGYFLLKGKHIFLDFFYNHQPLASYVSLLIQYFTNPQNIFELVLRHRQFILILGLIFNSILVLRFGVSALVFALIYEFSKFYLFGDRFLAEGMIVYPLVYMTGLVLIKLKKQKLLSFDYIVCGIFTWFVVFSREPYIPLVLFLFAIILYSKKLSSVKKIPVVIFTLLSLITVFSVNINEYFYNLIVVNFQIVIPNEIKGQLYGGFETIFFYPIFTLLDGQKNLFKSLLVGIDLLFLFYFLKLLKNKQFLLALTIFIILGLANLKPNIPGKLYYESFHMIIWYALFVFLTLSLIFQEFKNRKIFAFSLFLIFAFFVIFITSSEYFAKEKISTHEEFLTNYGEILQQGEVIKLLSDKSDTLFLDGSDDLIYWQAQMFSPYKYSWYTSVMPHFDKYNKARIDMFSNNPPDFYRGFGTCGQNNNTDGGFYLPKKVENDYVRIFMDNKPSCIYVKREKISEISKSQWEEALKWRYSLPIN